MYVCVCRAVTDKHINEAISAGARTMRELRAQLGVCSCCGRCGKEAREMLREAVAAEPPASSPGFAIPVLINPAWSAA